MDNSAVDTIDFVLERNHTYDLFHDTTLCHDVCGTPDQDFFFLSNHLSTSYVNVYQMRKLKYTSMERKN